MAGERASLEDQFGKLSAKEIWDDCHLTAIEAKDIMVVPGDPSTVFRGFSAALLVFAGPGSSADDYHTRVIACSEKQLLDLADEIQRRLRPDKLDRVLDALEAANSEHV